MKIVVLGAYGYTGALVCEVLQNANLAFGIAGRKENELAELSSRFDKIEDSHKLEMKDEDSVIDLVNQYDIFINCVGPFAETADFLLQYISVDQKMYVDITGEIEFVEDSRKKYHEKALKNKATILHSCAFESVLVNLLSHSIISDVTEVKSIKAFYNTGRSKTSPGTRLTMKLSKFRNDFHYVNGQKVLTQIIPAEDLDKMHFGTITAAPFALPEICFAKWDTSAESIASYLIMDVYDASYVKKSDTLSEKKEKDTLLAKFDKRRPKGPSEEVRVEQKYTIEVEVENKDGSSRKIRLIGKDYYYLSAQIACYFVDKYLQNEGKSYGVISPIVFLGSQHSFFKDLNLEPHEV